MKNWATDQRLLTFHPGLCGDADVDYGRHSGVKDRYPKYFMILF